MQSFYVISSPIPGLSRRGKSSTHTDLSPRSCLILKKNQDVTPSTNACTSEVFCCEYSMFLDGVEDKDQMSDWPGVV